MDLWKGNWPGSDACPEETVQGKSRQRYLVLFGLIKQDQEVAPALQRQSREGAQMFPGLVWEQIPGLV